MTAIRELLRSRTLWVGLLLVFGYWPVARYIPTGPQTEFLRISKIVITSAVSVAFSLGCIAALRRPRPGYDGQLVLGIALTAIGTFGSSMWILIWASAGSPKWMLISNINGWWIWLIILGYILHMTAHNSISTPEGQIPKPAWIRAGMLVGLCVAVGIVFLIYAPDMTSIAHWLKPMFADFPEQPD